MPPCCLVIFGCDLVVKVGIDVLSGGIAFSALLQASLLCQFLENIDSASGPKESNLETINRSTKATREMLRSTSHCSFRLFVQIVRSNCSFSEQPQKQLRDRSRMGHHEDIPEPLSWNQRHEFDIHLVAREIRCRTAIRLRCPDSLWAEAGLSTITGRASLHWAQMT